MKSKVRPLNLMENSRFPGMVDVYMEETDTHLLCVINWEDEDPMSIEISVQSLLPDYAKDDEKYLICDYYSGDYYTNVGVNEVIPMKAIKPHGANVFKVEKMKNKPLVVKSTGHYSMGTEFEQLEMQDGELHYTVDNYFDWPIQYEILLTDGNTVSIQI